MIRVGTSGFSYADWVGPVYPPGTRSKDFLEHYAARFDTVEVNYTYYRMPTPETLGNLVSRTGGAMRFAVKLTDLFTHKRAYDEADVAAFARALEPLAEADVLAAVLVQFPYSFKPVPESRRYLVRLLRAFADFPQVVEVRHRAWLRETFADFLRSQRVGLCSVDEPELPGLLPRQETVTGPVGYVRFHGRNADKWWEHEHAAQRYDYRYSEAELQEWVPRLRRMEQECDELLVFFNNHFEGKAVDNAGDLLRLLG